MSFHILLATNSEREFPRLAVAVRSVAESCRQAESLHFHVMLADSTESDWWKLEESWAELPSRVTFHPASDAIGAKCDDKGYGYWYRIWAAHILPEYVSRVLYLDCDTITYGDVTELWEVPFEQAIALVVGDPATHSSAFGEKLEHHAPRFGLTFHRDQPYFNSGVLFLDLEPWRKESLAEELESIFSSERGWAPSFDQDELNLLLQGRVKFITPAWNLIETLAVLTDWRFAQYGEYGFPDYFETPKIRHFAGGSKPDKLLARRSVKVDYYRHLDRTYWKGYRGSWDSNVVGRVVSEVMELHYIIVRGFFQASLKAPWRAFFNQVWRAPYCLPLYVAFPLNRLRLAAIRRFRTKSKAE